MAKSKWNEIEAQRGQPMKDILIGLFKLHGADKAPVDRVAAELGVSQASVSLWIQRTGLRQRVTLVEDRTGAPGADRRADGEQLLPGFELENAS